MNPIIRHASFHHIEVPSDDLELAERFYVVVFGARVYLRRDSTRRANVPTEGTISEAEERGFDIDATFLKIGEGLRIGFLKRQSQHEQREIDHLAFAMDDEDLAALARRLTELKIEVISHNSSHIIIRDPFGLMLELWPRPVLEAMGVL
jgi:catechol 2,3-dioxygenase-like lactoylglutathione lyase family enzyme